MILEVLCSTKAWGYEYRIGAMEISARLAETELEKWERGGAMVPYNDASSGWGSQCEYNTTPPFKLNTSRL